MALEQGGACEIYNNQVIVVSSEGVSDRVTSCVQVLADTDLLRTE